MFNEEEDRILATEISREGRERERRPNQYSRNRQLEEGREERPDEPIRQRNSGSNLSYGEKRRNTLRLWNDWRCGICDKINRATWFTCDRRRCTGKQTERQIPRYAWRCSDRCGQNNYQWDSWCTACLQPNTGIPEETRRQVPEHWRPIPRGEQTWYSRPLIINP